MTNPPIPPAAARTSSHTMTGVVEELVGLFDTLRSYAASVWFDEATATDEERELLHACKQSIARFNAERSDGVWVPREPTYAQWQRISTVLGDSLTDEETMEIYSDLLDVISASQTPAAIPETK